METTTPQSQILASQRPRLSRNILAHVAALPCLPLFTDRRLTQGEIVEALAGRFAANTVIDGLHALSSEDYIVRWRTEGSPRGIEYEITAIGKTALATPLALLLLDFMPARPNGGAVARHESRPRTSSGQLGQMDR